MPNRISDELILAAIDKGLSSIGERPKQALWFCLEKDLNINRQKVPNNLENFQQTLQRLFGLGYDFLETLFIRYLGEAVGEDFSGRTNFAKCVNSIRTHSEPETTSDMIPIEFLNSNELITEQDPRIHKRTE